MYNHKKYKPDVNGSASQIKDKKVSKAKRRPFNGLKAFVVNRATQRMKREYFEVH